MKTDRIPCKTYLIETAPWHCERPYEKVLIPQPPEFHETCAPYVRSVIEGLTMNDDVRLRDSVEWMLSSGDDRILLETWSKASQFINDKTDRERDKHGILSVLKANEEELVPSAKMALKLHALLAKEVVRAYQEMVVVEDYLPEGIFFGPELPPGKAS